MVAILTWRQIKELLTLYGRSVIDAYIKMKTIPIFDTRTFLKTKTKQEKRFL